MVLLVAEPTVRLSVHRNKAPSPDRDAQSESQECGDEEHVEVLDAKLEVHDGLAETTEEERAEEDGRRAVPEEQEDGGEYADQHQDDGELSKELVPEQPQLR